MSTQRWGVHCPDTGFTWWKDVSTFEEAVARLREVDDLGRCEEPHTLATEHLS